MEIVTSQDQEMVEEVAQDYGIKKLKKKINFSQNEESKAAIKAAISEMEMTQNKSFS